MRPLVLATAILAWLTGTAAALDLHPPSTLPQASFFRHGRQRGQQLADFKGRVVVLNFWATWCAPCKREMPSLDRLAASFDADELVVVALAVDRSAPEKLRAFMDDGGANHLPIYRNPKMQTLRAFKLPGLPSTLIIDAQGQLIGGHSGFEVWDSPEIIETLRAAL